MEDCVIFFLHHRNDEITNFHLDQFKIHNRHFKIVTINPSSYPKSPLWSYKNMWKYNDIMIYDWIDSEDFIKAKRYCWFDWDTLCEQSVDEYYGDQWDSDMAGTNIKTIKTDLNWQWFRHAYKNKNLIKYYRYFIGVTPFCGTIINGEILMESINLMKKENELWKEQNNELRLSTCAKICGANINKINRNTVQPFGSQIGINGKIFHPVKIKNNDIETKLEKFQDILIVSPAFSTTTEMVRDLNSSQETYKGWNINFIGRGSPMRSYIDAKILSVQKFVEINKDMFEWLVIMDSNDTLVIRDFDENFKNTLESFNKPIIFSGEANCYPLKELKHLYVSNSKIKYLNAGVIAIKKDFIKPLFDHVLYLYENYPAYRKRGYNPPGDQTYFTACLFSKKMGNFMTVDEKGLLSVSTALVPDSYFKIDNGLVFENSRPYILHCQGNDKHGRKRDFMRKLGIAIKD
jgi:hypothetical protein